MPVDVVVIGAGGFGRESLDVIEAFNASLPLGPNDELAFRVVGVADDAPSAVNIDRLTIRGYSYLGTIEETLLRFAPMGYFLGIGAPESKKKIASRMNAHSWQACTVIHPSASVGSLAVIGSGGIICGGVQLSTNTILGSHVHLNPNATIGHDTQLDDFVSVNPGAIVSGEVVVEASCLIGAGSVVLQGLRIGSGSVVGAGACVVKNVMPGKTMVGVPAVPIELQSKRPILHKEGLTP